MPEMLKVLKETIELLPDAVIVVDHAMKIVIANNRTRAVFDYKPEELVGQQLNILIPGRFHHKHDQHFIRYFQAPVVRRMGAGLKLFGRCKNGEEVDVDIALAPLQIGEEKFVIATIRDITELKEMERSLLFKNEELSLLNTQLERYSYIIAHDLKSPLLNIQAILSLMNREIPEEVRNKIAKYAKVLNDALLSMMELITGIADYSKISYENRQDEDVDLNKILREARKLIHLPPDFVLHVPVSLPFIKGNKTKVLQIFLNLINNAVKYNNRPDGIVEIQVKAEKDGFQINVADNGPGVPESLRRQIFDLYKKGEQVVEGSQGIGLAVVKKIVEDRGGRIWVEESKMGGSDFVFTWPAIPPVKADNGELIPGRNLQL